jgi:ABC-type sulfate/molybdate transport systems ATPase subunit
MPLLLGLAERVFALETGKVIAIGSPDEVVRHPEVVRSYLGDDPDAIRRSGVLAKKPKTSARKTTARKTTRGKPRKAD